MHGRKATRRVGKWLLLLGACSGSSGLIWDANGHRGALLLLSHPPRVEMGVRAVWGLGVVAFGEVGDA
jgi:hypothetical protein